MQGWIKIHRKFIEWEWYDDPNTKMLFLHLILTCNHKPQKWRGIIIKRGQKVTSYNHLATETGLSIQNVRTAINKLKSTKELTYLSTREYSIITVEKYDEYQETNTPTNSQSTDLQHTSNKPLTTNKKEKNVKNDKNEKKYTFSEGEFDRFWNSYDKKTGRKKTIEIWKSKKISSSLLEKIVEQAGIVSRTVEKQFRKDPERWVRDERWDDNLLEEPKEKGYI